MDSIQTTLTSEMAGSHPLSPDLQTPAGNRRGRTRQPTENSQSYFTPKPHRSSPDKWKAGHNNRASWDGSAFAHTPLSFPRDGSTSNSLSQTPFLKMPSSNTVQKTGQMITHGNLFPVEEHADFGPITGSQVLETKWHRLSDEQIQDTISLLAVKSSSSEQAPLHPYCNTIRVMSAALEKLSLMRLELEEGRRLLIEKEKESRSRAQQLLEECEPSDQEVVRKFVNSLFAPQEEERNEPVKDHAFMVSGSSTLT